MEITDRFNLSGFSVCHLYRFMLISTSLIYCKISPLCKQVYTLITKLNR